MKIGVPSACLAFAMLAATGGIARAASCYQPSEPYIPNAYGAQQYEMERAMREVEQYLIDNEAYRSCLDMASREAQFEADRVTPAWEMAVDAYQGR